MAEVSAHLLGWSGVPYEPAVTCDYCGWRLEIDFGPDRRAWKRKHRESCTPSAPSRNIQHIVPGNRAPVTNPERSTL